MLKVVKNNLIYCLFVIYLLCTKPVLADDVKMPKSTYQLLYAYSGVIDTNERQNNTDVVWDDKTLFGTRDDYYNNKSNNKTNNSSNQYKDTFIFAGIGFGTSGFGLNAGGNYKMIGIRFSAQTLKINSPLKINDEVSLKLFNEGDYGVDFMLRPTSYLHIDIGFHYFKNIVSVYYRNTNLLHDIGLSGYNLTVGGEVELKIGDKIVPYFGFGFNIRLFAQLYLDIDFGIMLTGDYKIKSFQVYLEDSAKNRAVVDVNPSYKDIEYITNYKAEQHNYKVWPIAKIGFSYRYNL